MTSRVIDSETDRWVLLLLLKQQALPFTVEVVKGRRRTVEQNRLQRLWLNEIAEQLGDRTPEEVRGYCKLTLGVPILRAESELFREKYDRLIKPMPYETKMEFMMEPLDFPVTRLMTTTQKAHYLDAVQRHFAEKGVVLTQPDQPPMTDAAGQPLSPLA